MKKLILLFISLSILICVSCSKEEKVKVVCPFGSPSVSLSFLSDQEYDLNITQGMDASYFISKNYEFIIAPFNLGAKMYINNKNYRLLSTLINVNYYITYKTDNEIDINNISKIRLFQANNVPDILLSEMISSQTLSIQKEYKNTIQDCLEALVLDPYTPTLLSEPQLSIASKKITGLKYISLSDICLEYENYPQACIFVRNDVSNKVISKFISDVSSSANKVLLNTIDIRKEIAKTNSQFSIEILESAIPRMNISVSLGKNCIAQINSFINLINQYNPNIIGGELDESFIKE